jgi:flagellar hook assembly protein FlgD
MAPTAMVFHPAFPNPFAEKTTLRWSLPEAGRVEMTVFDVEGREVRKLEAGDYPAGYHTTRWDGSNRRGQELRNGVYFVRLKATRGDRTQKLIKATKD